MVLKQRFADGRTNYIDIGDDWMLIQQNADDFSSRLDSYFRTSPEMKEECIAFVCWNRREEPIMKGFPQWIYSDNGELFMTLLTTPVE